jgi:Fe-S oxidoreductase
MWMEERIGQRVNVNRTEEAIATLSGAATPSEDTLNTAGANAPQNGVAGSDGPTEGTIAVGCPFCKTMLSDGLTQKQGEGQGEGVQVQDVSQMLLTAVKRGDGHSSSTNGAGGTDGSAPAPAAPEQDDATS